ncbi:MAG TPA: single-stranded DNA-binding protein [Clostridia bacterium]|nr:single-stranded DNA-binding protein [Clostridia bacterium]
MLNKVVLIGRLTRDPELRYTSGGIAIAKFTLAVSRSFSNQQGEREADFIRIVTWRGTAENCAKYLVKGRLVAAAGRIETGSYDDKDGKRIYTTEVVADEVTFLEWGDREGGSQPSNRGRNQQQVDPGPDFSDPMPPGGEDELPF